MDDKLPTHTTETEPSQSQITVRQYRSFWWEFFLNFGTLGLYAAIYLVRRTKDLNQVIKIPFTPWMWFFVPFIFLSQAFGLQRLDKKLQDIETTFGIQANRQRFIISAWISSTICLYYSITSKWETAVWLDAALYIIWVFTFTLVCQRISLTSNRIPNTKKKGKARYNIFEWITACVTVPLITALFGFAILEPLFVKDLAQYQQDDYYIDENGKVKIIFYGNQWLRVESGSFSNGEAIAEFKGPIGQTYVLLFEYTKLETLDDHFSDRHDWFINNINISDCRQSRHFIGKTLNIKALMTCEGTKQDNSTTAFITTVETDEKTYELLGVMDAPRYSQQAHKPDFLTIAKQFRAL